MPDCGWSRSTWPGSLTVPRTATCEVSLIARGRAWTSPSRWGSGSWGCGDRADTPPEASVSGKGFPRVVNHRGRTLPVTLGVMVAGAGALGALAVFAALEVPRGGLTSTT